MMQLIWNNFLRSGVVKLALPLLVIASLLSIGVGKQFKDQQTRGIREAVELQHEQFARYEQSFRDEIGYMLYYAKFSMVNVPSPLGSFSIGQRDINPTTLALTIRNIEGQKYDSDLTNSYNQHIGNIDFSFVLLFLFPLIIIGFTYNMISEEREAGIWSLALIQSKNIPGLFLRLAGVRVILVGLSFVILSCIAGLILDAGFGIVFFQFLFTGLLYILLWFSFCFCVISLRKSSSANALILLSLYLSLLIVLPGIVNGYLENKYPVPEAFEVTVKQRKAYHEKWDMPKRATMEKFLAHYPQLKQYPIPESEFSWPVYYAMQQMGDDESAAYSGALREKLDLRNIAAEQIARFIPSLHVQLQLNNLAKSDLKNHLRFLDAATSFHEKTRLHFYPKIFENRPATSEDWSKWKQAVFQDHTSVMWVQLGLPLLLFIMVFVMITGWKLNQSIHKK